MELLGVPPPNKPSAECVKNAGTLPLLRGTGSNAVEKQSKKCAEKAVTVLPKLPPGVNWLSETKVYSDKYLPNRIGRSGVVSGFGGDIDLLRTDKSELWDLKFVSKPVVGIKNVYVWQLGSYHLLSGVPVTGILFTSTDASWSGKLSIDWTLPHFKILASSIENYLRSLESPTFDNFAYPSGGEHCQWCPHKPWCPAKKLPSIMTVYNTEELPGAKEALEGLMGSFNL
jgi:hypothetical protein